MDGWMDGLKERKEKMKERLRLELMYVCRVLFLNNLLKLLSLKLALWKTVFQCLLNDIIQVVQCHTCM